jgi:hypothetical protein
MDVVGEQGDQRVQVPGLVGADERCQERLLGDCVGGGSRFALVGWRQAAPQAGAGPFEGAVDRLDGRVEHAGHLGGVESEDVAQDEHGELARRQDLKGGHEGQGDCFGLLIPGLGAERHVDRTLEEGVGIWLEPYRSPSRVGSGGSTSGMSHSGPGVGSPTDAR